MSIWANFISGLFTSRFSGPNIKVLIDAAGSTLDSLDPSQTNLGNQFSVTGANGNLLDENGADWGVPRRTGESDAAYRARILAVLPAYVLGPTIPALSNAVKPFTGVAPLIYTASTFADIFPVTFPMQFGGNTAQDYFTVHVYIQNPNQVKYQQTDVIAAVEAVKRVIATVVIHWTDIWTGPSTTSMSSFAGYQLVQQSATTTVQ